MTTSEPTPSRERGHPGHHQVHRRRQALIAVSLAVAALGAANLLGSGGPAVASMATITTVVTPQAAVEATPRSFADLVQAVAPAVVNITTESPRSFHRSRHDSGLGLGPGPGPGPGRTETAVGSGFVVDPQGLVVTNDHVVRNASRITVTLHDGRRLEATLRGRDPKTDLALLEVEADEPLPFASFGDSDAVRVGDWVVAVGNPFGLGGTVTAGIVSARGRDIHSGPFDDYLQVDAPINRGNSGGPLFDALGQVVGVNAAIFSPTGGNVGIGFAIPAALAAPIIDALREHGRVERGWIGVAIQPITADIAAALGFDESSGGALVAQVIDDSPAAHAGVKPGDIVVRFNGEAIEHFKSLPRRVADTGTGTEVPVVVWRDGRELTLGMVVNAGESISPVATGEHPAPTAGDAPPRLGIRVAPLSPELRADRGIDADLVGVFVAAVDPRGPAARKGLRAGDVILRIGTEAVLQPGDVAAAVRDASTGERPTVLLLVERMGHRRFVAVPLSPDYS